MARYVETDMPAARAAPIAGSAPNLIRWGAVFGGVVLGLSLLLLLSVLWIALAWGAEIEAMQQNIEWWTAASAVVAMFVGGLLAGWLSGVPGAGSGFFNGLAVWGLILIGSLLIGVPGALQAINVDAIIGAPDVALTLEAGPLWAAFFSLLIGALAAGIGGAIGGAMTRPAFADAIGPTFGPADRYRERETHYRDRDEDRYRDRDRGFDRDRAYDEERFADRPPGDERTIDLREEEASRRREP